MSDQPPPPPIAVHGDAGVVQPVSVTGGSLRDVVGQQTNYYLTPPPPIDPLRLAEAQTLLAMLPAGADAPIPNPALLAPCSVLSQHTPNPLFIGRDAELRAVTSALRDRAGAVVAVAGIGGVGKTQLAAEVAHRYGPFFAGGVFWVSMADPAGVGTAVAQCGARSLIDWRPDFGQLPTLEQINLVCSAWQAPLPRLLIFDNCEDPDLLRRWRPPTGGCRVLVTSRRADWGASSGVTTLGLGALRRAESTQLLHSYRADLADDAAAVAKSLGDLPLALHLAGSYLRRYRTVTAPAYLAQLDTALISHPSLQGRGAEDSPTGHVLSVAQTFALSYDQLRPEAPADATARALLARAARLAPGAPIPRALLLATLEPPADDLDATLRAEDGLARLVELGLIEADGEALRLHPLLAAYADTVSDSEEAQAAVEKRLLRTIERRSAIELQGYLNLQPLDAHLRHLARHPFQQTGAHQATLCYHLGKYFYALAEYNDAVTLYTKAEEIDPTDTRALFERARAYGNSGRLKDACADYTAIIERAPDHSEAYRNRALIYTSLGNSEAAAKDWGRVRDLIDHPADLLFLEAVDLQTRGEYEAAVQGYTRLLTQWQGRPDRTHVLWRRAKCYDALRQVQQAIDDYTAVIDRKPMDPSHYKERGRILVDAGRLEEAAANYRQLIDRKPHDGDAHYWLGRCYVGLSRYTEALQSLQRALEIKPSLNAARWQLGVAYAKLGRLEEAIHAYKDYQVHNNDAEWNTRAQRQIDALRTP